MKGKFFIFFMAFMVLVFVNLLYLHGKDQFSRGYDKAKAEYEGTLLRASSGPAYRVALVLTEPKAGVGEVSRFYSLPFFNKQAVKPGQIIYLEGEEEYGTLKIVNE